MDLTDRQQALLKAVVEEHHRTGRPVGSRTLVERGIVPAGASTIRAELGRLEDVGMLDHPHTSAGRVPTDAGYRTYVDHLLDTRRPIAPPAPRDRHGAPRPARAASIATRVEEAIAATTQALAEATELIAVVTAPKVAGTEVRHVEIVQLHDTMLVVVVITASGDVTRHVVPTGRPVDPGLVDWAAAYLGEQVTGTVLGQHVLRRRLEGVGLPPPERAMLRLLAPAFTDVAGDDHEVYVGGSPRLLAALGDDVQRVVNLVAMLDERRRLLEALRPVAAIGGSRAVGRAAVRIGAENSIPELHALSVVCAGYGVGVRQLGIVGVIGPRALDYRGAVLAVDAASDALGRVVDELHG